MLGLKNINKNILELPKGVSNSYTLETSGGKQVIHPWMQGLETPGIGGILNPLLVQEQVFDSVLRQSTRIK